MRWHIPPVVVFALFVAVSCDQQPVEPLTEQVGEAPILNFTNGPSETGNGFRWTEDGFFFSSSYAKKQDILWDLKQAEIELLKE